MSDFASLLTLGAAPKGMVENIFAFAVDLMISASLGIIFAFIVPYVGCKYLWFKGCFMLGTFWYVYYPLILIGLKDAIHISVQTHIVNAIIASLFGLVLAITYYKLHKDIQD